MSNNSMIINGKKVDFQPGQTVLETAQENGNNIGINDYHNRPSFFAIFNSASVKYGRLFLFLIF